MTRWPAGGSNTVLSDTAGIIDGHTDALDADAAMWEHRADKFQQLVDDLREQIPPVPTWQIHAAQAEEKSCRYYAARLHTAIIDYQQDHYRSTECESAQQD